MPSYVIVGASRGLGYEWLRQLSKDPANTVFGLVRNAATTTARLASDNIHNVHVLEADMVDHNSLNKAAAEISNETDGSVDYLIVNGAYNNSDLARYPASAFAGREDELRKDMISSLEVNVLGVIFSINAFLSQVRQSKIKKIIVISTGIADADQVIHTGNPAMITYGSMKAALNFVVAKYSVELKGDGIILLALSPGLVNTKETPPTPEEIKEYQAMVESFKKAVPGWNRALTPAESVSHMVKVIDGITLEQSGSFLSHWGNKQWL